MDTKCANCFNLKLNIKHIIPKAFHKDRLIAKEEALLEIPIEHWNDIDLRQSERYFRCSVSGMYMTKGEARRERDCKGFDGKDE